MSTMLGRSNTVYIGCCSKCARRVAKPHKPNRRSRHQARAVEKRRWRREES